MNLPSQNWTRQPRASTSD